MKSRLATLFCLFAVAACGTDTPKEAGVPGGGGLPPLPGPPGSDALGLEAQLDGRYIKSIRIEEGEFTANGPGQEIPLTFAAQGMSNVKQFEFRLEIDPVGALSFEGSSFAANNPFVVATSTGMLLLEDGQWAFAGAIFGDSRKEGDDVLGTAILKTRDGFDAQTQVSIRVSFFSMGPSFSDRDKYFAEDLNIGVVVNGE